MDCHEAQAKLELTTLGEDLASGRDVAAARRHLAECDQCHLAFESQQRFDAAVARAMSDVPLPAGLTERLVSALPSPAAAQPATPLSATAQPGGVRPTSRRRLLQRFGWGAVALLVPLLIWGVMGRAPALNDASVMALAELDLNVLPVDSRWVSPAGWSSRAIQLGDAPRRAVVKGADVSVLAFLARLDRRSSHTTGILIRLSPSQWQTVPDATSFASATVQYAPFGTWVVWREADSVFVCVLRDGAHSMQRLQEIVAGSRQLT